MVTTVDPHNNKFLTAILNGKQQPNQLIIDDAVKDNNSVVVLSHHKINELKLSGESESNLRQAFEEAEKVKLI
jgi:hypothetical protein